MGKSKGGCFRIMDCAGGYSASTDDLLPPESKTSSDKCRWSFRKRVSEPRVLSKNAILEPECVCNKDSMGPITSNFNSAKNVCVSEKSSIQKFPSKEDLPVGLALSSTAVNPQVSATVIARNGASNDENYPESSAIIVQAAIRGHLAVRKLRKVKYVIKLQAAVRGHLVRVQAVGTLRCIRAITKVQAIFRARLAIRLQEKVADMKLEMNRNGLQLPEKVNCCEGSKSFHSNRKLLSNRFSQKLLASTPKTSLIYIKCDPSKSDSVRKWLERWMTIITPEMANKGDASEFAVASESKGGPKRQSNLHFRSAACLSDSYFSSVVKDEQSQKQHHHISKQSVSFSTHILESALAPQQTDDYSSYKTESKGNNSNNTTKRYHSRPSEIEVQKVAIWPMRPGNPAFSAVRSKFEMLGSNSRNVNNPIIQVAASECGTEISISSTLDSPDRSETECGEIILEIASMGNHKYNIKTCSDSVLTLANKGTEFQTSESNKLDEASESSVMNSGSKSKPRKKNGSTRATSHSVARISTEASRTDLDDEPRMSNSNSSISLPSYMQATKAARAKVYTSISSKPSPYLCDKDNLIKKRHSLPIDNGKQDSSPTRAQHNPKSNGTRAPQTSAERRWQR